MTMPSLIQSSRKQETSARLKKFNSTMSQAILLSENDNGPSGEWIYKGHIGANEDGTIPDEDGIATKDFFMRYLAPYMKYLKIDKSETNHTRVYFVDGSSITMHSGGCTDMTYDTNGDRKPNIAGRDRFVFLLCPEKHTKSYFGSKRNFGSYMPAFYPTRESALSFCKSSGNCSVLLEYDGWEFKADYPWRL